MVVLREKNKYYGQVQLGMAILNVENCKFVLYSSFDKNIFVIDVPKDRLFIVNMLRRLKQLYYAHILPEICFLESQDQANSSHADRKHLIVKYEGKKRQVPPAIKHNKARPTSTPKKPMSVPTPGPTSTSTPKKPITPSTPKTPMSCLAPKPLMTPLTPKTPISPWTPKTHMTLLASKTLMTPLPPQTHMTPSTSQKPMAPTTPKKLKAKIVPLSPRASKVRI
ncbi:hypothetical protein QAD02_015509 [Eretmocerus hayati]|uniref:Uncharacterized protein n=1 Tax=Eretmocerus hayati TaxID=131215 RepID=A0ACC2PB81_9HYME|nr:hypothetical protein QAD02_015509 [Eretmocerus hayati]